MQNDNALALAQVTSLRHDFALAPRNAMCKARCAMGQSLLLFTLLMHVFMERSECPKHMVGDYIIISDLNQQNWV